MIPALGRQRQEELCEFQASLVYIASSRPAGATGKPCLKKAKKKKKKKKKGVILTHHLRECVVKVEGVELTQSFIAPPSLTPELLPVFLHLRPTFLVVFAEFFIL